MRVQYVLTLCSHFTKHLTRLSDFCNMAILPAQIESGSLVTRDMSMSRQDRQIYQTTRCRKNNSLVSHVKASRTSMDQKQEEIMRYIWHGAWMLHKSIQTTFGSQSNSDTTADTKTSMFGAAGVMLDYFCAC